jgi:hypothetical protein
MMRPVLIPLWLVLLLAAAGCQELTPEQQAKADASQAAFTAATEVLGQAQATMAAHVKEYNAIKVLVDAGQSVPAATFSRFLELQKLVSADVVVVKDALEKFNLAKKANDEAAAAGVAWYERIPWGTVVQVGGGILLGLAGLYFPVVRPLTTAGQAMIQGVAAVAKNDPNAGQVIKDAVCDASRALGVDEKVAAMVKKFDPPVAPPCGPQNAKG